MAKRRVKAVDALKLALERERGAFEFYCKAYDISVDPDGQRMFNWLAQEESRHLAKLRQQLDSVLRSKGWLDWETVIAPIERKELPSQSEAKGTISLNAGEQDILHQAINSEKESILFYREAEQSTPDLGGKLMFGMLAEEEKGHLTLLEGELEWVAKYRRYFSLDRFDPETPI